MPNRPGLDMMQQDMWRRVLRLRERIHFWPTLLRIIISKFHYRACPGKKEVRHGELRRGLAGVMRLLFGK
jgi:hypothetical protein